MHCDDFMAVFPYNIYNMVIKWMKRGKKPSGDLLGPQNWPIVKKWISTYFWAQGIHCRISEQCDYVGCSVVSDSLQSHGL